MIWLLLVLMFIVSVITAVLDVRRKRYDRMVAQRQRLLEIQWRDR